MTEQNEHEERYGELISRSLDGDLSADERAELDRHLAGCADCRRLAEELETLNRATRDALTWEPSEAAWETTRRNVKERVSQPLRAGRLGRFHMMAIAAILLLSVLTGMLGRDLINERTRNESLERALADQRARLQRQDENLVGLVGRGGQSHNGLAEQVQVFTNVQDYLGSQLRWIAIDGRQVEIGMSGTPGMAAADGPDDARLLALKFQYVERTRDGRARIVSQPNVLMMPGEEAVVRLHETGKRSGDVLVYRLRADRDEDGRALVSLVFEHELRSEARSEDIRATISATVRVEEDAPVLLGASGDLKRRRELYLTCESLALPDIPGATNSGKAETS